MTRPANLSSDAVFDAEFGLWIEYEDGIFDNDGYEYEVEKHYDEDGHLIMILEMEV